MGVSFNLEGIFPQILNPSKCESGSSVIIPHPRPIIDPAVCEWNASFPRFFKMADYEDVLRHFTGIRTNGT